MHAAQFADALAKYAPLPKQVAEAWGDEPGMIDRLLASFRVQRRPEVTIAPLRDPLIELVVQYDVSSVEIGAVRFDRKLEQRGAIWIVGSEEADLLVLDETTGEIRVEELGTDGHVLYCCARSGSAFLDALAIAADLTARMLTDRRLVNDGATREYVAMQCAAAAGGEAYTPFWMSITGR